MVAFVRVIVLLCAWLSLGGAASGFEWIPRKSTLFLFAGEMRTGTFPGWTMVPFAEGRENNYIVGAAHDTALAHLGAGIILGAEVGLAGRFGDGTSAEIWGGPSFRHHGLAIGNFVTISPGVVVGLSGVTSPIGVERTREIERNGNAALLFYIGPELAFRFNAMPNTEFVVRTHHRSGGQGALGRLHEGHNASTFGVRFPF